MILGRAFARVFYFHFITWTGSCFTESRIQIPLIGDIGSVWSTCPSMRILKSSEIFDILRTFSENYHKRWYDLQGITEILVFVVHITITMENKKISRSLQGMNIVLVYFTHSLRSFVQLFVNSKIQFIFFFTIHNMLSVRAAV